MTFTQDDIDILIHACVWIAMITGVVFGVPIGLLAAGPLRVLVDWLFDLWVEKTTSGKHFIQWVKLEAHRKGVSDGR